jgi:hypothetical protein
MLRTSPKPASILHRLRNPCRGGLIIENRTPFKALANTRQRLGVRQPSADLDWIRFTVSLPSAICHLPFRSGHICAFCASSFQMALASKNNIAKTPTTLSILPNKRDPTVLNYFMHIPKRIALLVCLVVLLMALPGAADDSASGVLQQRRETETDIDSAIPSLKADLQAVAFSSMSPNPIAPGGHPQGITFSFANHGPERFDAITYKLYLSRNTVFGDADDLLIGQYDENFWPESLYPGWFEDISLSTADPLGMSWYTIPDTASGSYFVIMRVVPASFSGITDTNLANNVVCSTTAISVGGSGCTYSITPVSVSSGASGTSMTVQVTAPDTCLWAADNQGANWVSFSSNIGLGSTQIAVVVAPNDTCLQRTARTIIAGEVFFITQAAGAGSFSLSASNWLSSGVAETNTILVTAGAGCSWSVVNPASGWITVTPANGTGTRAVAISVLPNTTGLQRSSTLRIAGQTFVVNQAGVCNYNVYWPAIYALPNNYVFPATNNLRITLRVETYSGCSWSVLISSNWLAADLTNGQGNGTLVLTAAPNTSTTSRSAVVTIADRSFTIYQAGQLIGPVTLLTPKENETVGRYEIHFSWKSICDYVRDLEWYHIYISTNGQKYLETWVSDREWYPTNVFAPGDYTWRVQGWNSKGFGDWSSTGHFTVQRIPPKAPDVRYPTNGASLSSTLLTYNWTLQNATWYEVVINRNGSPFLDKWVQKTIAYPEQQGVSQGPGGNPSLMYIAQPLSIPYGIRTSNNPCGLYSWRVRGWNPDGYGEWSESATFTNVYSAPQKLYLFRPEGPVLKTGYFDWNTDPSAEWYCITIYSNGSKYASQWLQTPQYSNSLPLGSYTWTVQAWNQQGLGPVSDPASFSVVPPGSPFSPMGTISINAPAYSWFAKTGCTWYEIYVLGNQGAHEDKWYFVNNLSAINDALTTTNSFTLTPDTYRWWVRGWHPTNGLGAWSSAASFTVSTSP